MCLPCPLETTTHYSVLGISPSASTDDIKRAFRAMALQYHPDKNPGQNGTFMSRLNDAHMVLGDPASRGSYDQQLCFAAQSLSPFTVATAVSKADCAKRKVAKRKCPLFGSLLKNALFKLCIHLAGLVCAVRRAVVEELDEESRRHFEKFMTEHAQVVKDNVNVLKPSRVCTYLAKLRIDFQKEVAKAMMRDSDAELKMKTKRRRMGDAISCLIA